MTGQQDWARLDELLDRALAQPPERRRAWLAAACAGDDGLRSRVESLLELAETNDADLAPGGGLRGPVWDEVARELCPAGDPELPPGTRLGRYEIRELLGAGGMGRVYRAHDPGLNRDVAVKALSRQFAAEPTSLRRFEREAKLLAQISHPNIARFYEFHVLDGRPILVLELVEGKTLADILTRHALPPAQAITVARQVAEALEEAHRKGIVHRDLKPSNVEVVSGGQVKVLDFGLARRLGRSSSSPGSTCGTLTHEGMVLGTIPYMSPEQAQGERVDGRTDVWALGCLLYEMLTGRRAIRSRTLEDLLESLLKDDVDLSALPAETPTRLRRVIRRCLRRDPRQRYQSVGDARLDLEELEEGPEARADARLATDRGPWRSATLAWTVATLAVAGAIAMVLLAPGRGHRPAGEGARRFVLDLPPGVTLPRDDPASPVALSPDGSTVVLVGREEGAVRLYRRRLEHLGWAALPGTEGARQPFFSFDGSSLGFFAGGHVMRVSADGRGGPTVVAESDDPCGGTWTPDGTIIYGPSSSSGLLRVDARGGMPQPLTELADGEGSHRWPQALPDGRTILFTVEYRGATLDEGGIETVSLETGRRRRLLRGGTHARLAPGDHVIYARRGRLFAVPFDRRRALVTGGAVPTLDGVDYDLDAGAAKVALAGNGTLAYVPVDSTGEPRLVLAEGWAWSLHRREGSGGP